MFRQSTALFAAVVTSLSAATDAVAQQPSARTLPQPLTLPAAIEIAKTYGALARAARHTLEAARASFHAYSARQLPQAFLSGDIPSYNRSIIPAPQPDGSLEFRSQQQTNSSVNLFVNQNIPWTGGSFSLISQLAQLRRTGAEETWRSTPFSLNLTQPILRSNTLKWIRSEQGLSAELAERAYHESMEDVASATATAYVNLFSARETMRTATDNLRRNEQLREKAQARSRLSAISSSDVRQIELGFLRAQQSVSQATLTRDEADATFRAMLGLPSDGPLEIVLPGEPPEVAPDTARALAAALRNRSDVVRHELQDTRARRAVSEARFDGGLGATITASYGYNATAPGINQVYRDLLDQQSFRLNLTFPLWQWGASSADREAAHAGRAAATATAQDERERMRRDVVFAVRRLAQARYGLAIATQADSVAADRLQDALIRYDFGGMSIENLFFAISDRDLAAQQRISSLSATWTEYYRLRRATMHDFETDRPIR